MSLRKKEKEIRRLISAFEKEAEKFHDISFSIYFLTQKGEVKDKRFDSPNHAINLWQFYGKVDKEKGIDEFVKNLKDSNFQ